jgi:hypothetical protein
MNDVEASNALQPAVKIKESTADSVLAGLYPNPADLLKRFEAVKAVAGWSDTERDRLRKYIQDKLAPGAYDNVILGFSETASQIYPNAEGKHVLKAFMLSDLPKQEEGITVVALQFNGEPEDLLDKVLHHMQTSKEAAAEYLRSICLGSGVTMDNLACYLEKGGMRINITILPEGVTVG